MRPSRPRRRPTGGCGGRVELREALGSEIVAHVRVPDAVAGASPRTSWSSPRTSAADDGAAGVAAEDGGA